MRINWRLVAMNNNFLDFIKKDIEAKKTLISTLPTKTMTNKKKVNSTIDATKGKYLDYADNVRNYINAKKNAIKIPTSDGNLEQLRERVKHLEYVKSLLNPINSYFEKLGFDTLLYEINNYYIFNFHSLNDIINGFLDKFEQAGILLNSDNFDYTCYVNEYMSSFLEVRRSKSGSYARVSEIFEEIYWTNPELIEHIEINFRKLIRTNAKKFQAYIESMQRDVMTTYSIASYEDCLMKLRDAYIELNLASSESLLDICNLALDGAFDIEQYFKDHKVRIAAYSSLIPDKIDYNNEKEMGKICASLEKLKCNVEEYSDYIDFYALFKDFKDQYTSVVNSKEENRSLAAIVAEINKKEEELAKFNRRIGKSSIFDKREMSVKRLKAESVCKAKELYELYKKYDLEYFKDKVIANLSSTMSVSELLELYYSFDYFKKLAMQKVYNITDYNIISEYNDRFDAFATNPRNIVMTGVPIFESSDIPKIIANKYRLNNINLDEDDLSSENLKPLLNKILLILRTNKIENSSISLEQIWFIVKANKLLDGK